MEEGEGKWCFVAMGDVQELDDDCSPAHGRRKVMAMCRGTAVGEIIRFDVEVCHERGNRVEVREGACASFEIPFRRVEQTMVGVRTPFEIHFPPIKRNEWKNEGADGMMCEGAVIFEGITRRHMECFWRAKKHGSAWLVESISFEMSADTYLAWREEMKTYVELMSVPFEDDMGVVREKRKYYEEKRAHLQDKKRRRNDLTSPRTY